ncbi:MAG: tRNA (adenosine(37)-N6)-threonylcarbamoyltransferase complex ATPase subunit type 1 TsaE, partial [Halanaerobiales bacterium]
MAGYVLEYMSKSEKETLNIGEKLGRLITKKNENNLVVLLKGDLGAGKTLFVKGMGRGLNIETKISSPTYNIIN